MIYFINQLIHKEQKSNLLDSAGIVFSIGDGIFRVLSLNKLTHNYLKEGQFPLK